MRRPLIALALGALAATALAAAPVDAKSISLFGIPCSDGTAISGEFLSQGSRYTLGFQTNVGGQWHFQILDNGVTTLDYTTSVAGGVPTGVTTFRTLDKGVHVLTYQADLLTTGVACSTALVTKV